MDEAGRPIRESMVDGLFYPSEKEKLETAILALLKESKTAPGDAFAVITPHAGLEYVGSLLAAAYRSAAKRRIKTVVMLGPMHRDPADEPVLPTSSIFQTPLGQVSVDLDIIEELLSCTTALVRNDIPHLEEHSIEIQLPFIQVLFPKARIVPILLGSQSAKSVSRITKVRLLSRALQLTLTHRYTTTLFVATTNFSSYLKRGNSEEEADRFIRLIESLDWIEIMRAVDQGLLKPCGAEGVAVLLALENIAFLPKILDVSSSSKIDKKSRADIRYASVSLAGRIKKDDA
jgi:AmmeMemoRadiSam system protein B